MNQNNKLVFGNGNVDAKEKTLWNFSTKLISTVGTEGTRDGCLVSEAIKLFDKDWPLQPHTYFVRELGCADFLELLDKLDKEKVNLFMDNQYRWRLVVKKNENNKEVLDLIDNAIHRKKNGIRPGRSGNIIPLRNEGNYQAFRRGRISFEDAAANAARGHGPSIDQLVQQNSANRTSMTMNNQRFNTSQSSHPPFRRHHSQQPPPQRQKAVWPFPTQLPIPIQKQKMFPSEGQQFAAPPGGPRARAYEGSERKFSQSAILPSSSNRRDGPTNYMDWDSPLGTYSQPNGGGNRQMLPWHSSIPPQQTDSSAMVVGRRLVYNASNNEFLTAGARIFRDQFNSIKAEANSQNIEKQKQLLSQASSSGVMASLSEGLASMKINHAENGDQSGMDDSVMEALKARIVDDNIEDDDF